MYRITLIIFIIGLLSPFTGTSCCAEDNYGNLTELLNDPTESRYPYHAARSIFTVKIDKNWTDPTNGFNGFKNMGIVQKVYRGDLEVGKQIIIGSGGNSSAGGTQLRPGDEYIIFSRSKDGKTFHAFVCDGFSRKIKSEKKYHDSKNADAYIKVINEYFKLKNSKFTGKKTFKLGKAVLAKGNFKDGLPHGDWKHYIVRGKDSNLKSEIQYKDGVPHGKQLIYKSYGKRLLKSITTFKEGKEVEKKYYSYKEEQQYLSHFSTTFYHKDNSSQKSTITYYGENQVRQKHNEIITNIKTTQNNYPYRFRQGKYISYFENGQVKEKGEFYRGAKIHDWYFYNEDGSLSEKKNYKKPEHTEYFTIYHVEGFPKFKGQVINGIKEGQWKFYSSKGHLYQVKNFENGIIQGDAKNYWGEEKTIQSTSFYKDGKLHGEVKSFYKDGKSISSIANYDNGKKDGVQKSYFEDGSLRASSFYKKGIQYGEAINYRSPNILRYKKNYENGILNGHSETYNREGKLLSKGNYKMGTMIGHWIKHYNTGELYQKCEYPAEPNPLHLRYAEPLSCETYEKDGSLKKSKR